LSVIFACTFLFFCSFVLASVEDGQCEVGKDCPTISITVRVINDGAGELDATDFLYHIMWGKEASNRGTSRTGLIEISTIINIFSSLTDNTYPIPYEVYTDRSSSNANVYGEGEWQSIANFYKPYWQSGGGTITFSAGCSGILEYGQSANCEITFNDGDVKYGWDEQDTIVPLSTPGSKSNRSDWYVCTTPWYKAWVLQNKRTMPNGTSAEMDLFNKCLADSSVVTSSPSISPSSSPTTTPTPTSSPTPTPSPSPSPTPTPTPTPSVTPSPSSIPTPGSTENIAEGALIRAIGDLDIYIVKYVGSKKFKRLILSPSVFNSYGHLKWSDVLDVEKSVIDLFTTSELVRAVGDAKAYKLYPAGDAGEKRWIKTSEGFNRMGYDWDAVYEINTVDRDSYMSGVAVE